MNELIKKYFTNISFEKAKTLLKTRTFWGALLFATSLLAYTSLNQTYAPYIKLPLTINIPKNKALETQLPDNIAVKVKGSGWELFYLFFFNTAKQCVVQVNPNLITDNSYLINRTDFIKGLENIVDVETIDVSPESMMVKLGKMKTKKIPVYHSLILKPKEGFIVMEDLVVTPDSIEIRANEKVIDSIDYWITQQMTFEDIYQTETFTVPLSDSLNSIVELSQKNVKVTVNAQQLADITFYDIPVKVRGGSLPSSHKLQPDKVSIVLRGGVEILAKLSLLDLETYIDYEEIIKDSTGIIQPKIKVSDKLSEVFIKPNYIHHFKQIK